MNCLLRAALMSCLLGVGALPPSSAQTTAEEAVSLAETYVDAHNAHELDRVITLYSPQATFQLSFDRGLFTGHAEIRGLERFDVIAGSAVFPFGLQARQVGERWHVSARGVVEYSRVFSAMGMKVVTAWPQKPIMQFQDGLIVHMEQPPVAAACLAIAQEALSGASSWLTANADPRAEGLVNDAGLLDLKPHLLPLIADLIKEWRLVTSSSPDPAQLRECGTVALN